MTYLYGDSTTSDLEENYIEFLRAALDLSVHLLLAEASAQEAHRDQVKKRESVDSEIKHLENLHGTVASVLTGPAVMEPTELALNCAEKIRDASGAVVRSAIETLTTRLAAELKALDAAVAAQRGSNVEAFERFILRHDLPETTLRFELALMGATYRGQLVGRSSSQVAWATTLSIPKTSLFKTPLRVDKLAPGLEIKVPEKAGLVKKSVKLKSQKLANKWVTELLRSETEGLLKLRSSADEGAEGYDIQFSGSGPAVRATRVGRGDENQSFDPAVDDQRKLQELFDALSKEARALSTHRERLVSATLDGKSFAEHTDATVLCKRLIDQMSPTVREISMRSLTPNELVLKRVVDENRREEIFASKAELLAKMVPVPPSLRGIFSPLGLGDADVVEHAETLVSSRSRAEGTEDGASEETLAEPARIRSSPPTAPPSERRVRPTATAAPPTRTSGGITVPGAPDIPE